MPRKNGVQTIVLLLLIILTFGSLIHDSEVTPNENEYEVHEFVMSTVPHAPIIIDGDENFTSTATNEGWSGNGSVGDPFIITNYEIDLDGGSGSCINITNTRSNFTISNCNLTGASTSIGAGIYLNNVSYGSVRNTRSNLNYYGISLQDSSHILIFNNTITGNSARGINLNNADSNTITDNICTGGSYGIYLLNSDSNIISRNLSNSNGVGMHLSNSVSNNIDYNTCNQNSNIGIRVENHSDENNLTNNICNDNGLRGILLDMVSYVNIINNTCNDNYYGLDIDGYFIQIINNTMMNNFFSGIYGACGDSLIQLNRIDGGSVWTYMGIGLMYSSYTTITRNEITTCGYGISISYTTNLIISQNQIVDEIEIGIEMYNDADYNTIVLNDISVYHDTSSMEFSGISLDSSTTDNNVTMNSIRNYPEAYPDYYTITDNSNYGNIIDKNWYEDYDGEDLAGDGYGDSPYPIQGTASNSDSHPLMYLPHAPIWTESPSDQVLDYWSQPFYYDLNATAPTSITWAINDTSQFTIDSSGIIQSITNIPVGLYGIRVKVTNFYGISINASFQLVIQEITPPEWIVGPMNITVNYGEILDYGLIATDESGIEEWAINETIDFQLVATQMNVTGYQNGWKLLQIINVSTLVDDEYPLNLTVIDRYGNALTAIFTITISSQEQDITPPLWTLTPTNQILEYNESLEYYISACDPSGIWNWIINDTSHFSITPTYYLAGSTASIINKTTLGPGFYPLNLTVLDNYGNKLSSIFTITINPPLQDIIPPEWIVSPTDQILLYGQPLEEQLAAWDESGIDYWVLNDTIHFLIDENNVLRNNTFLQPGVYILNVSVYDTSGNTISKVITITVSPQELDMTNPIWIVAPADEVLEYGESFIQQLGAWDESGIHHWWINDTEYFTMEDGGILRNATVLAPGSYCILVKAFDPSDNFCSATAIVTIHEPEVVPTITITTTVTIIETTTITIIQTPTDLPSPNEGMNPVMALFLGTGLGGTIGIIIIIVLLKKKS